MRQRKKNSRQRGSQTHGWGAMKKHRGAGNRGGRGMAGSGKRGDSKKPKIWKIKKYFGKHGFKSKIRKDIKCINLNYIETHLEKLIQDKKVKSGDFFEINLSDLGAQKLLGAGKITKKYKITCDFATKKSIDKITALGGEVIESQRHNVQSA